MAVISYTCDVCKRTAEFMRHIKGTEIVDRCTITAGCRGKLFQSGVHLDYNVGRPPKDVPGLDNWQPRHVLHNHTQYIERSVWIINHRMGTLPTVIVYVQHPTEDDPDNLQRIDPISINPIDQHTVELTFDRPWSGIAQLIAKQSDPKNDTEAISVTNTTRQISNNGELTVATRISTTGESSNVNLQLTYTTTDGANPIVVYVADNQPSVNSAWIDFDKVVIKGTTYTVRSFNTIIPEMSSGIIRNGSTFQFTGIDERGKNTMRPISVDEIIILTATAPYELYDKDTTQYIDVTDVSEDQNSNAFVYDTGEITADRNIIRQVYPPIRSI